jgi:hypothetical protein
MTAFIFPLFAGDFIVFAADLATAQAHALHVLERRRSIWGPGVRREQAIMNHESDRQSILSGAEDTIGTTACFVADEIDVYRAGDRADGRTTAQPTDQPG